MPTLTAVRLHEQRTATNQLQYQFTPKHHGQGGDAAQWLPELTWDEEFSVFDMADLHQFAADDGSLYGLLVDGETLRDLGTWTQQIAKFPVAREGEPWHGYPVWAVNDDDAPARQSDQKNRPPKTVFLLMEEARVITARDRKRLFKGDHV
jgi:hypothetical protein